MKLLGLADFAAVERDVRANDYPRIVARGDLTADEAEHDWRCWRAIAAYFEAPWDQPEFPSWGLTWADLATAASAALRRREEACVAKPDAQRLADRKDMVAAMVDRLTRTRETGDVALPRPVGGPDFHRRYSELLALRDARRAGATIEQDPRSWTWLIDRYLASAEFAALADSTQVDYLKTCELLRAELGPEPFALTTRRMLKAVRDGHAATPRKAHKLKQMASRLYSWAGEGDLVPAGFNPAAGFKRLARKGGEREIAVWSDAEIAWVLAAAAEPVRTAVMLALYTGQRRSDVRAMRWNQWQGDTIRVRQAKTHALLDIACHPDLRAYLERLRTARAALPFPTAPICLNAKGEPWASDNALSGAVRRTLEGIPQMPGGRSLHGLRYAAGSRMEEGGATVAELEAVLGHRTFKMALKYAGQRLRAARGIAAMPATERGGNEA